MYRSLQLSFLLTLTAVLLLACSDTGSDDQKSAHPKKAVAEIGVVDGYSARVVLDGLRNPSSVSFSPSGELTVCDTGHGRVLLMRDGKAIDWITGFTTEFWKKDAETGKQRFELGPLSAIWIDQTLVVTDGGLSDGAETLAFFTAQGAADSGTRSAPVKSLETDPKLIGEGNLVGLSYDPTSREIYVGGQGDDTKTWVLRYGMDSGTLEKWASADEHGITVNSPMQTMIEDDAHLLVLYSGAGGKDDGLLVRWDRATGKPVAQWTLPGLADPMGIARIPGSQAFVVVDNNWSLTEVKKGKLARVTLGSAPAAEVSILADGLMGPVSCAFGPDRRLYISQLGSAIDAENGQVIAVQGF